MQEPTRIAVVGYGLIGRRHAAVIQRLPELSLCAVVEKSAEGRAAAQEQGFTVYDSLEALIEQGQPEGIVLATPTPVHPEQCLNTITAGIPTLVEKPIAVTAADARIITNAARSAGVPLLVGHHRRHNGMVEAAKAALDAGAIGEVRAVQATCWFYKPDYYFDVAPWRTKKGAGPISVNLVHDVDLLRYFCGEVVSVQAVSAPSRRGFENEDLATAILRFASGAIATISVSDSIVSPWSWELTARENPAYPATQESCYLIGGSKGGLSLPDLRLWTHEETPDWWTPINAKSLRCEMDDPLVRQMQHFARVITGDEAPLVTGLEGLKSLEVVEAVAEASATGREIRLDQDPTSDVYVLSA
jgi:predicted dehydrogenase